MCVPGIGIFIPFCSKTKLLLFMHCRYLVDVVMTYEEDGQMIASAYQDGIKLSATYNRAKKQSSGCCGLLSADDCELKR